jgi:peptidoglycan/LPS O-acetylase OafA/YrhL
MPGIFTGGYYGVDLFFVLSGYLITTQLLKENARTDSVWLGGFYMRRLLRLTPALITVAAFAVSIYLLFGLGATPRQSAFAITYLMDVYLPKTLDFGALAHTWSLAVEEQFYLLWPALLIIGLRRRWPMVWVVSVLMATAIVPTVWIARTSTLQAYFTPFAHVGELGAGAMLALVLANGRARQLRWTESYAVPIIGFSLLAVAALLADQTWLWQYYGGFTAAGLVTAAVIAHCISRPTGTVSRLLGLRPLTWLGERSYGIYLWHYPILFIMSEYGGKPQTAVPVAAVASVLLAALSYRFVERPFNRIKDRRFASRVRGAVR